jgi:WD40 repeat protein
VAFSPDSSFLVSVDSDGKIKLWDLSGNHHQIWEISTTAFRTIPSHRFEQNGAERPSVRLSDPLQSVAFSPDGTLLAAASGDGLLLLDPNTAEKFMVLDGNFKRPCAVTFSPDAKLLIWVSAGSIKLWNLLNGDSYLELGKISTILSTYSLDFSPDGKTLASSSPFGPILLGDPDSAVACRQRLTSHEYWGALSSPVFSPDGNLVAASKVLGPIVRLFDVVTGQPREIGVLRGYDCDLIRSLQFSPDSKLLAAALKSLGYAVQLWDVATGKALRRLVPADSRTNFDALAFSPDCTLFALVTYYIVQVWDLATGEVCAVCELSRPDEEAIREWRYSLAFSSDNKVLYGLNACDKTFALELRDFEHEQTADACKISSSSGSSQKFNLQWGLSPSQDALHLNRRSL